MTPPKDLVVRPSGWTFTCGLCGFVSQNWRTEKLAKQRKRQHMAEHEGADPVDPPRNDPED